jgi:serine/threonine-protein kinase RsbW
MGVFARELAVRSIKLPAEIGNLRTFVSFVSDCARVHGFRRERISDLELAVEEAIANICLYAYDQEPGEVEINCFQDGGSEGLVIEIRDTGKAFDMQSLAPPDLTSNIEDRDIGGLGVFLIRKVADESHYVRQNDQNILRLVFRPS